MYTHPTGCSIQGLTLRRARLCAATQSLTLPTGVTPITLPRSVTEGVCHVCGEDAEYDGNHLLQCDACGVFVHTDCYSVQHRPDGRLWLCDVCRLGLDAAPPCALCPVVGGAMKPTDCGRWVHCACALWVPETCPLDQVADAAAQRAVGIAGTVSGLDRVPKARKALLCYLCKQPHGACIQCAGSRKCLVAFHPLCARGAGLTVQWLEEERGALSPRGRVVSSGGMLAWHGECGNPWNSMQGCRMPSSGSRRATAFKRAHAQPTAYVCCATAQSIPLVLGQRGRHPQPHLWPVTLLTVHEQRHQRWHVQRQGRAMMVCHMCLGDGHACRRCCQPAGWCRRHLGQPCSAR